MEWRPGLGGSSWWRCLQLWMRLVLQRRGRGGEQLLQADEDVDVPEGSSLLIMDGPTGRGPIHGRGRIGKLVVPSKVRHGLALTPTTRRVSL